MQISLHVTPQLSVYAYVLDEPDQPVVLYQRRCTPTRQPMQSTCNLRYSHRVFMTDEQPYWEVMGYHFIGRLQLPRLDTPELYRKRLDSLVSDLDALVRNDPQPADSDANNRRVLEAAAQYVLGHTVSTVLVGSPSRSHYDWADSTA